MKCSLMNLKEATMTTMGSMDLKWVVSALLTLLMQIAFSSISSHPQVLITKKMKISLEALISFKSVLERSCKACLQPVCQLQSQLNKRRLWAQPLQTHLLACEHCSFKRHFWIFQTQSKTAKQMMMS